MNSKRKGTAREHRSIALLEAAGYRCTRAAASLGAWDVIGVGSTDIRIAASSCTAGGTGNGCRT